MGVRIAVVQQNINAGKVDENRAKAVQNAVEALTKSPDLILFHEEMVPADNRRLRELAEPADGPTTQAFQAVLKGTDARILYGLTERVEDSPSNDKMSGRRYNTAVVVSADGIVAKYSKTHLFWKGHDDEPHLRESNRVLPGEKLVTFPLKGFSCGIMICYDGDFPEMTRSYAVMGCSMLFWLNCRGSRGYEETGPLAGSNSMIMATCNPCGPYLDGPPFRGGSNIVDETGTLLTDIWDKEGIIVADVFPERVPDVRRNNASFVGRRPELYCR